jgi:APA family basic amino acid/polyamine antiporter
MNLLRRKSVAALQAEAEGDQRLHRTLGALNLTLLGVGAIIGTGIFVLTGTVAAQNAGPAVILSFVLAGVASVFAALCYSEFASLVPMSGSAYTYGYASLGEFFAWVIGWDLILEYAVGAVTVAIGWSGYVVSLAKSVVAMLEKYGAADFAATLTKIGVALAPYSAAPGAPPVMLPDGTSVQAVFNLPAVLIVALVTILLVVGVKESARFNNVIVLVKLAVVLIFLVGAAGAVQTINWHPFIPANAGGFGKFGFSGVMMGASIVFFAYIGFDAVSTAAQEARNPQRDLPIGIIGSLLLCTVLYILVSAVATGVVRYDQLDVPDPIALAADRAHLGWMAILIKVGALAGLSSVILVMLYGQSRVFFSMAGDGLLPPIVQQVHPRFRTPWLTSIITGVGVAFFAGLFTVREAGSLCSIGTLLAFVIVSVGVLVLRVKQPELKPRFRTPAVWLVAPAGALSALALMLSLPLKTWVRLLIWFALGLVVYFLYSVNHSKLAKDGGERG